MNKTKSAIAGTVVGAALMAGVNAINDIPPQQTITPVGNHATVPDEQQYKVVTPISATSTEMTVTPQYVRSEIESMDRILQSPIGRRGNFSAMRARRAEAQALLNRLLSQ